MELLQKRTTPTQNTTTGKFYVNGVFQCYGLEPTDRGLEVSMSLPKIQQIKVPGHTCQPTGRFKMDWYQSPDHGIYLPRVLNVPGYEDDEIHVGNFEKDTLACLLLGTDIGVDMVLNSKTAINAFYPLFKHAWDNKEPIFITYERTYSVDITQNPIKYTQN